MSKLPPIVLSQPYPLVDPGNYIALCSAADFAWARQWLGCAVGWPPASHRPLHPNVAASRQRGDASRLAAREISSCMGPREWRPAVTRKALVTESLYSPTRPGRARGH